LPLLSSLDAAQRHIEYTCHEPFADFLGLDLVVWIEQNLGKHERYWLCGLSLSGLAAIYTALRHPQVFSGAIGQSPSAWWNREWLTKSLPQLAPITGRFWISVGDRELDECVSHPPTGLYQEVNQLDSCRNLSQQLTANGADLKHVEFAGGHDPQCWARELSDALQFLVDPVSRQ
jgi:enterochelin esterase family protein